MSWPEKDLDGLCQKIGSGITPRGGAGVYVDEGVALFRSQNVYNGEFVVDGLVHITDAHADAMDGVEVTESDVLLNITGDSVARCCRVPSDFLPARVNQHVAIIRPKPDLLDSDFLCYFLVSPQMQARMLSLAGSGGTRKALTKSMIERFRVPAPSIDVQKNVVSRLRPLDSLIANNRRRIELLEQSARELFREWFVRLRYPGHEHDKVVDGVPAGWRVQSLERCARFLSGGTPSKARREFWEGDIPWVSSGELTSMRIHDTSLNVTAEAAEAGSRLVPAETILAVVRGMSLAKEFRIGLTSRQMSFNQDLKAIVPKDGIDSLFLYHALEIQRDQIKDKANDASHGTKKLETPVLSAVQILIPPSQLVDLFRDQVSMHHKQWDVKAAKHQTSPG
jgi:restriction endonuclease S subunit